MRWDALFSDLAGQADAADDASWRADAQGRERSERSAVSLADRLAAAHGSPLTATLLTGDVISGTVRDGADEWVLLEDGQHREHVIPLGGVASLAGLPRVASLGAGISRRLSLAHALRAIARDRARVAVVTQQWRGAGLLHAVGSDYLDIGEPRGHAVSVPLRAVVCVSAS